MTNNGLVLPQKLEADSSNSSERYGKFVAEPFERGYGHTVGHSLRRILLSSLSGAAVSAVRAKGAQHEFSTLKGVREDVIHIILNLKKIRFKLHSPGPETLKLKVKKQGEIKASDIEASASVEILTPDVVIAHADSIADLDMELEVSQGRGYSPAERHKRDGQPVNTIPVDALYSPVSKVNYEVANARVGQMTDYDKLIIEVWTDGSIAPQEAVTHAAKILKDSLNAFIPLDQQGEAPVVAEPQAEETATVRKDMMEQSVDIIELSVRASNCLKAAKIRTIGELISKKEDELLNFKNFGKKSLDEIRDRLEEMDLKLGMEISN